MLGDILKIIGEDVFYYTKEGVSSSIEESIEQFRMEMKACFREYSVKTQKMMVDTAIVIVFLAIGLIYVASGLAEMIDFYAAAYNLFIAGLGGIVIGVIALIIAMQMFKKSRKELES